MPIGPVFQLIVNLWVASSSCPDAHGIKPCVTFWNIAAGHWGQLNLNLTSPLHNLPISGRVDRASATEAVDSGSIPGRVKPKTIKIGIHSFPA